MIRIAPLTLLLAGAILLGPIASALAISTEEAPAASDGTAVADPDDQLDEMASPDSGTAGDATIEVPQINVPGADSGDYLPPDSDGDPAQDPSAPQGDSGN